MTFSISSRWFLCLAWVAILSGIFLGLTYVYWLTYPYGGMTSTLTVRETTVHSGELLSYTVKYCVDTSVPVPIAIDRELELQSLDSEDDMLTFPIAPQISYVIRDRCETKVRVIGIPAYAPPGEYHIHAYTTLRVNPVREIRASFVSTSFSVVPKDE